MPPSRSILISAGGTGGGVYPAVAVAEALQHSDSTLHFIGSVGGMESSLVPRNLFTDYHEVYSGPLNGVGMRRAAISAFKVLIGTIQAWQLVGRVQPALLFLTGGWATFPAALACWLRRVPIVIFLPDIEPALAIRLMSRLARVVLASTAESIDYFPKGITVIETSYPLRENVVSATREAGLQHFDLDPARKTVLVFGGSRGARSLNTALAAILPDLLADGLQIVHISGDLDWPTVQAHHELLSAEDKKRYHAFAYLHDDMGLVLAAADLVVSRAGASTLGEFPHFGLPSILVPYPFAWRYQKVNADWLVERGAAVRIDDGALSAVLLPTIRTLLSSNVLETMQKAATALAHPNAAGEIATQLVSLAQRHEV